MCPYAVPVVLECVAAALARVAYACYSACLWWLGQTPRLDVSKRIVVEATRADVMMHKAAMYGQLLTESTAQLAKARSTIEALTAEKAVMAASMERLQQELVDAQVTMREQSQFINDMCWSASAVPTAPATGVPDEAEEDGGRGLRQRSHKPAAAATLSQL